MAVANKTARIVALAQVNKEGSAIVVAKDSMISRVPDLENKTVAVPGYSQVQDVLLRKALSAHKVDPQAVTIIVLKPPEMITALRKKWNEFILDIAKLPPARTKDVKTDYIQESRRYKYMRVFWCENVEPEDVPDDAFHITGENGWTMYKWLRD